MDNQVTQADRDAVKAYQQRYLTEGVSEAELLAEAFAAHRIRHTEAAMPNSVVEAACRAFSANLMVHGWTDCPVGDLDDSALETAMSAALATLTQQSPSEGLRESLWLFREFVQRNATQWKTGAGHHHPIWAMIAEHIGEAGGITAGHYYEFIQSENRAHLKDTTNEQD